MVIARCMHPKGLAIIVLVTTTESSEIYRYSQELAKRVSVPTVETRRYCSLKDTLQLVGKLSRCHYPLHFPSQHFGHYGLFLLKPYIITVHDLVRLCFPFAAEGIGEKVALKLDALGLKRATHIIAVSNTTKTDLARYLHIPEAKVSVVYNGVDRRVFKPIAGKRFDFPYLLYVGSERPRKNLGTLLTVFAILKAEARAMRRLKLVKVGSAGRTNKFRQATLSNMRQLGLENEVIFFDGLSDEDLAAYYSSAMALVIPSFYEKFGLPVVEAMACGCPVIAANTSSLPEIAGDAALFFSPHDSAELARLIHRLTTQSALRCQLIQKGFARVKRFSWDRAAMETQRVYDTVLSKLSLAGKGKTVPAQPSIGQPSPSRAARPRRRPAGANRQGIPKLW